jgi:gluconate kinase
MDTKAALKAHMAKGKNAHPDANVKKLKKGGPTSEMMRREGRNLARVANQRGK